MEERQEALFHSLRVILQGTFTFVGAGMMCMELTTRRGLTIALVLFAAACGGSARVEPAPPAADSLVKLTRKSLNEPDPVPTALAIICEMHRLTERYGEEEGLRLAREARRVAYAEAEWDAVARRDSKLGGHTFPGGEAACTTHPDSTRPVRPPR